MASSRCDGCGTKGPTVMTTAAGRRLCQDCANGLFGKVAALLAEPDAPVAGLIEETVTAPGWADKVRAVRRRRSARG